MSLPSRASTVVGVGAVALAEAWLTTRGYVSLALILAAVVAALSLSPRILRHRGLLLGLLVLGAENGLPFLDTAQNYVAGYAISNYMVLALIVLLAVRVPRAKSNPGTGGLALVGALLGVWWLATVWHSGGEPLTAAAAFGRNFLLFALLAALFPLALSDRRDQRDLLVVVCAGALLYAVGEIVITVTHQPLSWLVHPVAIRTSDVGLERVYAFMGDSAVLLLCLSLGAALLAPARRVRRCAAIVALVSAAAILLQQTRAIYLALALAVILVLVGWLMFAPGAGTRLAGRTVGAMFSVAAVLTGLAIAAPSLLTTYIGAPLSRLSGAFVEYSTGTGDLGSRFHIANDLLALLHGDALNWVMGLGFLDPKYRYFSTVPFGSIRNSDLGLVDGIMLVGVVGVALIYLVALIPLRHLAADARSRGSSAPGAWLIFGLTVWLVQALLGSYTLATLWLQQGQVLVAMVAGLAINACQTPEPARSRAFSYVRPRADRPALDTAYPPPS